jgi:hypothetical protein
MRRPRSETLPPNAIPSNESPSNTQSNSPASFTIREDESNTPPSQVASDIPFLPFAQRVPGEGYSSPREKPLSVSSRMLNNSPLTLDTPVDPHTEAMSELDNFLKEEREHFAKTGKLLNPQASQLTPKVTKTHFSRD